MHVEPIDRFLRTTRTRITVSGLLLLALVANPLQAGAADPSQLVENGDFATGLGGWSVIDPAANWVATDANASAISGSIEINEPAPTDLTEIGAARQCIALPSPGTYELTAKGNGGNLVRTAQDLPKLRWAYRLESAGCSGPVTVSGELFIPPGGGWNTPNSPVLLPLGPQDWTATSTFELELVVERNANDPETSGIFARFDDVSLRLRGGTVFANDYE